MTKYLHLFFATLILSLSSGLTQANEPAQAHTANHNPSSLNSPSGLISVEALSPLLAQDSIRLIDFRKTSLPGSYIPGAVALEHRAFMENRDGRKRMLVDQTKFEEAMSQAGISPEDHLVIYDEGHSLWAARLWWSLKAYGHQNVQILDGGLAAWKAAGNATKFSASTLPASHYRAQPLNPEWVANFSEIPVTSADTQTLLLDARGTKDTDRGIILDAQIIEWSETKNSDNTFKSIAELQQLFKAKGFNEEQKIIVYCNTGIKASLNTFVLRELLGFKQVELYDGSMVDYQLNQPKVAIK